MSWIPAFEIGVWNAWIFMIIYPLQWLAVVTVFKRISERVSHPDEIKDQLAGRTMVIITEAFWLGATLYSIFLPLRIGTGPFYVGLSVFFIGLAVFIAATIKVLNTPAGVPFTKGIYKFSRHPMYLSMILVYLGVSIAAISWLFLLITIITFFLQRYQMIQEEKYCCEKFGSRYREYMATTPRWMGIPIRSK